jgi:glycosyltransferase involved in cell wall biosynthesis
MPVRNEAAFIERSLASVMAQDYPMSQVEIVVVDGMSEDGTRQTVEGLARRFPSVPETGTGVYHQDTKSPSHRGADDSEAREQKPEIRIADVRETPLSASGRHCESSVESAKSVDSLSDLGGSIRLVDNPGRIVPKALNLAIEAARGQWLIRLDAHAVYPPDYVRLCIETAQRTGADNVGGVVVALPRDESAGARLIQALSTSSFGVGGARFRVGGDEGPADTVAFGCFRREVFAEVGLFDERLVRNQDYEFNRRLARAGKRIWLNPAIQAEYYNQATLGGLFRQAFGTGKWNPWVWFVAPYAFAPRHVMPGLFVAGLSLVLGLSFLVPWGWIALAAILVPYAALAMLASVQQARRYGFGIALPLPFLFFAYHCSYGLGTLWGALRLLVGATPVQRIREPWPGAGCFRAWPNPDRR